MTQCTCTHHTRHIEVIYCVRAVPNNKSFSSFIRVIKSTLAQLFSSASISLCSWTQQEYKQQITAHILKAHLWHLICSEQ